MAPSSAQLDQITVRVCLPTHPGILILEHTAGKRKIGISFYPKNTGLASGLGLTELDSYLCKRMNEVRHSNEVVELSEISLFKPA